MSPRKRKSTPQESTRKDHIDRYQVAITMGPIRKAIIDRLVDSELYGPNPTATATILLNKALEMTLLDGTLDAISPSQSAQSELEKELERARQERR